MTSPEPEGKWAEIAVRSALNDAKVTPFQIDAVSAHGTGTILNDAMEAELIARIFSAKKPYILALKSWIGHLAAACGAVELSLALICMANDHLPEARNLVDPCHQDLNFVRKSKIAPINIMLLENFGFGGQNSAIVVKKWS